jgi:hypothetical protein
MDLNPGLGPSRSSLQLVSRCVISTRWISGDRRPKLNTIGKRLGRCGLGEDTGLDTDTDPSDA